MKRIAISIIIISLLSTSSILSISAFEIGMDVLQSQQNELRIFPDNILPGDILLMDAVNVSFPWGVKGPANEHSALYLGYNTTTNKHDFINAGHGDLGACVQYATWEDTYGLIDVTSTLCFLRVNGATPDQIQAAIDFTKSMYKRPFQYSPLFPRKENNPDAFPLFFPKMFYCSEFVWAAYYNCDGINTKHSPDMGIDIDYNGWTRDSWYGFFFKFPAVYPQDILNSRHPEYGEKVNVVWKNFQFE